VKSLIGIIILLFIATLSFGQGLSIGANLGFNYDMSNSGIEGAKTLSGLGFGGGLVLDLSILPMLGAEVDVQYAMYKYNYSDEIGGVSFDSKTTINNLVVPVLFKYKMSMPTVSPYFVFGPSLIKNLSGTGEVTTGGITTSADVPDSLLETDFGIQVGAGANLGMVPNIGISPYFRFQYNLTANDPDTDNSETAYDFLFGVNFTYKIK